jgi:Protein of unknown function (DUF3574)
MALSLAACAAMRQPGCQRSERLSTVDSLYFGAAYPGGVVTAEQWQMFVDSVVTPRFPEGLTLWQAAGQYRTNAGIIQHEASWVLQLVHQDAAQGETAIDEIRTEYRRRFRQESVLRVRSTTCVSFE